MVIDYQRNTHINEYLTYRKVENYDIICLTVKLYGDRGCKVAKESVDEFKKFIGDKKHSTLIISFGYENAMINNFFIGRCCSELSEYYSTIGILASKDSYIPIVGSAHSAGKRIPF